MHGPWLGTKRIAVILARVTDPAYDPAPADWADQVRQRLFYQPTPAGVDVSLRAYIHALSSGQALLDADVFGPVDVPPCGMDAAIHATPTAHLYEYACVVFTGGAHNCGGWAFWDSPPFPFNPPRSGNVLRNWCRVSMKNGLGVWGMEVLHMTTGFGDLYNTSPNPSNFDNMACSCGTHLSSYTLLQLGWLPPAAVPVMGWQSATAFTLHSLTLLQPAPSGRVSAIRIPSKSSQRYFLVEARMRADVYDAGSPGVSSGIPSEGVVVYEVDEAAWPVRLRTPVALTPGQSYSNTAEQLDVSVTAAVWDGYTVTVQTQAPENPACPGLRDRSAELRDEIQTLQADLQQARSSSEKAAIVRQIKQAQAQLKAVRDQATKLGCRPL